MKTFKLKMMCWLLPTNALLRKVNHTNFTDYEAGIIGAAMLRRFDTPEELEARCELLFGGQLDRRLDIAHIQPEQLN